MSTLKRTHVTFFILTTIALASTSCSKDEPLETASISGTVSEAGSPAAGVSVYANDELLAETDATGGYIIPDLEPGDYTIRPAETGRTFSPAEQSVILTAQDLSGIDFERVALSQLTHKGAEWSFFNQNAFSVKLNNAITLQLDLEQNALWFNASVGGAVFREVTGDFTLSATVTAVKKSNNAQPADCNICLGGIMARNPNDSPGQNYVHLVTGATPEGQGYESKNTTNNVSEFTAIEDGEPSHELRITREGNVFSLYKKAASDADWVLIASFERPDLPATLQVGPNIYTAESGATADLSVIYQDITLEN